MSKHATSLLIIALIIPLLIMPIKPVSAASPNTWVSKALMQVARSGLGVATVNGKIYAIGGFVVNGVVTGANEEYDPTTDTWESKASMPTPRVHFATAGHKNKIYCIGGTDDGVNEVYDPATDTWETKTSMPTPRGFITANVVNGKIYIIGGDSNKTINEVYDPETDSWATAASMPTGSWGYASAVVNNRIYIIDSNLNQIYDVETDTWSLGASPPGRLGYGKAGLTTGVNALKRIYVIGEKVYYQPALNQVYDPQNDRWTQGAAVPTYRGDFSVAVADDLLYAIGGYTIKSVSINEYLKTNEMYEVTYYATNEQYVPFGYGTPDPSYDGTAPEVTVASPQNITYYTTEVALNFTVNETVFSMRYALDRENAVEISGNTTLTGLSYGERNLTVYATDASGNVGTSETITFTIAKQEPFPTTPVLIIIVAAIVLAGAGFLLHRKRVRGKTQ
jgi:N-acetylneuraminic acid mutarotase